MATERDPEKDISFLLAVAHNLTITSEFADTAIANWPTDLCSAPADGEDLGRGIYKIWQKWIGNEIAAASGAVEKKSDGTSSSKAIIIDDSDDEIENPSTPISSRILPCKFRIPPAASLGIDKVVVTPKIGHDSKIVVDLGKSDHEEDTPAIDRTCLATKNDAGLLTPCSLEKAGTTTKKATKFTKTRGFKPRLSRRKRDFVSSIEPDEEMIESPFAIASSRKRRHGANYNDVPADGAYDNSDDGDFSPEEPEDDKRIDQNFEAKYPVLDTPSKRQKKAKS
ncbi:hypothetical protein KCU71_g4679, partial [Aureobasidium melanogenum]